MAEVKVKITAQNEVRTGLQQALQETQKFSQEAKRAVSQTMTINPFAGDDRLGPLRELQQQARALRERASAPIDTLPQQAGSDQLATTSAAGASAIRGLAIDLANATSPAQVFEAVIRRISTAFGGLVAASAGFAVGTVIRRAAEDAAQGLNNLLDQNEQLARSLQTLTAPTTTFQEFTSTLGQVQSQIESLQKATEDYKSSIGNIATDFATQQAGIAETVGQRFFAGTGQFVGRIADRILGNQGQLFEQADANEENSIREARLATRAGIAQQLANELQLAAQVTEEGRRQVANEQERVRQRKELENLLTQIEAPAEERQARLSEFDRLFRQRFEREQRERDREKSGTRAGNVTGRQLGPGSIEGLRDFERAQEAAARALGPEFGPGTADAAAGGFRVDAANFAAQEGLRLAQQQQLSGSFGASSLQRIGFASNEFFGVRQQKDPAEEARRAAEFTKQILELLKKGEPLVLPASS